MAAAVLANHDVVNHKPGHSSFPGRSPATSNHGLQAPLGGRGEAISDVFVTIVDECPTRRRGIVALFVETGFMVEPTSDLTAWLDQCGRRVAILVIRDESDLAQLKRLLQQHPEATVVALVPGTSPSACKPALRAGATAVISQDAELEAIVTVVAAAVNGYTVLPREVGKALRRSIQVVAMESTLSSEEVEWLRALAAGRTIARLAEQAGYSERSLHRHLARLYGRLGASNRRGYPGRRAARCAGVTMETTSPCTTSRLTLCSPPASPPPRRARTSMIPCSSVRRP